jgi:ketosteroid isomerase-like protein
MNTRQIDPQDNSGLLSVTPMGRTKATSRSYRNRCLAMGVAVLVMAASAASLSAMGRAEKHETRHQIESLEDAWRSAVLKGNVPAIDALLAEDYMAITPTGILQSKEQTLASVRGGSVHFNKIDFSDRKIRLYGTTALVTSRADVAGNGPEGDISGSYRHTRVYVKDARGKWRIVSFEASRIREPGGGHRKSE